jgi:predicted O-methyltransferase YrrM
MSRYQELLTLIDQHKPQTILEIGVWNGQNAIRMINQAAKHNQNIEYIGYDLFEEATSETDAVEFNVKGHNQVRAVEAEIRAATPKGTSIMLIKGNTRETLSHGMTRDLVFLDGGHSIETIASDYDRVNNSKIIVLDDYYSPDENGDCPDITKFGCNLLVTNLPHKIMPTKDRVKGGGFTSLVVVCQ